MSTATVPDLVEAPPEPETAVVALADIRPGPNIRNDYGNVEGLAEDIRKWGVLHSLVVCPEEDGGYLLLAGGRRYRAALLAQCEMVPVTLRPRPSHLLRIGLQLSENDERLDLAIPEVLGAVQEALDLGATDDELAATVRRSTDEAALLRGIVGLGPAVHELIATGDLTLAQAAPLTELADAGSEYIDYAVTCMHRGFDPVSAVRQAKGKHRHDTVVAEATALAESRKLRLVEAPRYGSPEYRTTQRLGKGWGFVDVPAKQHSKLPCHAAYINGEASSAKAALVVVCTDAKSHRPAPTPVIGGAPASGELTPAQKAVATKRHRKAWRETHAPRSAAITRVVTDLDLDEAMARVAWHVLQDRGHWDHAYLGAARLLVGSDAVPAGRGAAEKLVLQRARQSGQAALRVAVAVLTARAEDAFQQPRGVYDERLNVRDHFRLLTAHEYALKEAELDHLRDEYSVNSLSARLHADPGGYGQPDDDPTDEEVAPTGADGDVDIECDVHEDDVDDDDAVSDAA